MSKTLAPFVLENNRIYEAAEFPKVKIEVCASNEWRTCFDTGMRRVVIARKDLNSKSVWYSRNYDNRRGILLVEVRHPDAGPCFQISGQEEKDIWHVNAL